MADIFLQITGDPYAGESIATNHVGQITVLSWSWGESNSGSMASGTGGGGTGKVSFSDFNIMMSTCKASPNLLLACAEGTHIPTATLWIRKAGGSQLEFLQFVFTSLLVSGYQISQSGGGGEDLPSESISFNFAQVQMLYAPQKDDGTLDAAIAAQYNIQTQAAT